MRLNLLNQTVIITGAVNRAGLTTMNPRFGEVQAVNKDVFKYSLSLDPSSNLLIGRVDLGDLFKGLPQDISRISFKESGPVSPETLEGAPELDSTDPELITGDDELGQLFVNWTRLVGIGDLLRKDVDLSTLDDCLMVEAHRSVVYKGAVSIKIK